MSKNAKNLKNHVFFSDFFEKTRKNSEKREKTPFRNFYATFT